YNTTADPHPIHLHMVSFQLIDRQKFSATQVDPLTGLATPTGPLTNIKFQGRPKPAAPSEAGLLDTVIVQPGEMVRIAATFGLPGKYAWHCHILSHEDNEMMRPYEVIAAQPTDSLL
ncbi:MAG: multicopper oxidase domain-containing protein, partial [Cyanobium sp.]